MTLNYSPFKKNNRLLKQVFCQINTDLTGKQATLVNTQGTTVTNSVPNNTETTIRTLTIPSDGLYLINAQIGFSNSISSLAIMNLYLNNVGNISKIQLDSMSNDRMIQATLIRTMSANQMINLRVYQASGSAQTVNNVYFSAIKIG